MTVSWAFCCKSWLIFSNSKIRAPFSRMVSFWKEETGKCWRNSSVVAKKIFCMGNLSPCPVMSRPMPMIRSTPREASMEAISLYNSPFSRPV